eukprot:5994348-Amphidinium_carterae.1
MALSGDAVNNLTVLPTKTTMFQQGSAVCDGKIDEWTNTVCNRGDPVCVHSCFIWQWFPMEFTGSL